VVILLVVNLLTFLGVLYALTKWDLPTELRRPAGLLLFVLGTFGTSATLAFFYHHLAGKRRSSQP
jgi:hypothetical protein